MAVERGTGRPPSRLPSGKFLQQPSILFLARGLRSLTLAALFCVFLSVSFRAAGVLGAAKHQVGSQTTGERPATPEQAVDFDRDVKPILQASCVACHGPERHEGQLRLDSEAAILRGGVSGKAVIPGNGRESLLVKRLLGGAAPRMPLGGDPLPPEKIALIRAWIDRGSFSSVEPAAKTAEGTGNRGQETGQTALPAHVQTVASHPTATTGSVVFATQIRPILAARCYACHGPAVQQNGLRVDSLEAILAGSANGKVVVLGHSKKSHLVRRLLGLERPQMPYGAPPLSAEQIDLVRKWVDEGARGPDSTEPVAAAGPVKHWAYIKPERPEVPQVKDAAWCRNPIDNFILARLEKEGLSHSPEADRTTLIRRLSLDLVGLPPSIEEVEAFLADKSPNAYEKVVDRLLASPHYGERWAQPWLDYARYADSHGFEEDPLRVAWEWRDWLINALNQDMSFKEFTIEQIAGDMLPNPTTQQLVATGFHRNTMLNHEGGVDREEYRWYSLIDRVSTTANVWLGITLECAQCHNHKFDPFTQKDFYRMLAFFDNNQHQIINLGHGEGHDQEPEIELPTPDQEAKSKALRAQIAETQTVLNTQTPALDAAQAEWEAKMKKADEEWTVLRPSHMESSGGATLKALNDGSVLASGKNPEPEIYVIEASSELTKITGLRIEVMNDPSLPQGGPGRDPEGNFLLSRWEVAASSAVKPQEVQYVATKDVRANESQDGYDASNLAMDEAKADGRGWAIDTSPSKVPLGRQAVLIPEKPFGFEGGTLLTIRLKQEMRRPPRNLGRFRLSATSDSEPESIVRIPARLLPVLDLAPAQRSKEQKEALSAVFRSATPLLKAQRDRLSEVQKEVDQLGIATAMIMKERQGFERPWTNVHVRGSYLNKAEKVYADVPASLPPLPEGVMPNRLGLAYWLVDENNPLTARVEVNRIWETIFGRGIVETSENFGTPGTPPTHPELLDWLATEFMRQGWSMKKMVRLIVTSSTYRQPSRVTPELLQRDPYNRLLARGPRFRVEAETVRDIALAASGLLSPKMGGPSVFPYQPEGIWDRPYSHVKWEMSEGEDRYRRGIYTFIRRTAPYPSLTVFDAPSREFCTIRRVPTNTPLQALTTLNDPAFFEAARALARKMMTDGGPGPAAEASYGFRRCVSRAPTKSEGDQLLDFYRQQRDHFENDPKAAGEVVKNYGNSSLNPADQAAWTMLANVLLNMDETITKE